MREAYVINEDFCDRVKAPNRTQTPPLKTRAKVLAEGGSGLMADK